MSSAVVPISLVWLPHGLGLPLPLGQSAGAAGADLAAALVEGEPVVLAPGQRAIIPCGFCMALPIGYEAQVRPRSGLAAKHGVTVLNSPGTIDADYRGEVKVILINLGQDAFAIVRGDRIAQLVVAPVNVPQLVVETSLDDTARGSNGFGSTGKQRR
jgi:dUTP pyrophosphatase